MKSSPWGVGSVFALATVLLGVAAWWGAIQIDEYHRTEVGNSLSAILETTHQAISSWSREQRAATQIWADSTEVVRWTNELLASPRTPESLREASAQAVLRDWYRLVSSGRFYEGFFVIAPDNISLGSTRDANIGVPNLLVEQPGALERLWSGETILTTPQRSDVPLLDETGTLREGEATMFVGAPIRDEAGTAIALLTFRIRPESDFTAIFQRGRIGATGETYAFNADGVLISESRFDAHLRDIGLVPRDGRGILTVEIRDPGVNLVAGEKSEIPRERQPLTLMAASAVAGERGQNLSGYRDYRGVPVIGAWLWDQDLALGIATEIDLSEVSGDLRSGWLIIVALTMFAEFLLVGLTAVFIIGRERILRSVAQTALLAAAVEQAAETVVVTDTEGTIEYVNPAFERSSGYSAENAIGQNPRILKSGEHAEAFYTELWDTIKRGEVWRGILINKKKDGTFYEEETTISPLHDPSGKITNFIAVKDDVTGKRALEEQLRQAQKMEAIGQLAGGVAHDFNNLLTGITGYAQLVLNELPEDGPLAADLCRVIGVAERAAALTRQLLAFSRRQTLQFKVFDLNDLVENISKLLKRVIDEDIQVEFVPAPDLGSVRADPGQIEQVVLNLTVNARDAIQGGGKIIIETSNVMLDEDYVRTHAGARAGPHVMLAVTDTGCGMDVDTLQQIFEPFFTTKKVGEGTGLGLATVYGIVKQHEGSIWAYSELGKGTSFKVYLPLVKEEAQALAAGEQRAAVPSGTETILLVEDDEDVRAVSQRCLEKRGYEVLVAAGPDEAEELFSKRGDEIAVLVSDIVMPDMDGASLYSKLQERNESLKVLFMSGYAQHAVLKTNVLEAGRPFMAKPFTAEQLAKKVREVLDS